MDTLTQQILAILFVSLRIAPVFAFAPPFTLMRVPALIRLLISLSLSIWLVFSFPEQSYLRINADNNYVLMAAGELLQGGIIVVVLQWCHAAILTAGRTIDVQAGFGLALLIDPTSRAQIPLIGTIFAYAAGLVFFAMGGGHDLLAIWGRSLQHVPLGAPIVQPDLTILMSYIASVFVIALGLAGIVLLALFMIDLTVAFLSRTLPQMNVLLIGFQVKTLAVLTVLPLAMAYSAGIYMRLVRLSLDTAEQLL